MLTVQRAQCIVQVLSKHVSPKRLQRLDAVLRSRVADTTLCLENLTDEGNIAAIMRTAEALGLQEVHVVSAWAGPNPERPFRAVSKSAEGWLQVHHHKSLRDCFTSLRQKQYWIAATHLSPAAIDMQTAIRRSLVPLSTGTTTRSSPGSQEGDKSSGVAATGSAVGMALTRPRVALCVGNESRGCSSSLVSRADCSFFIPQPGMMQSMNVSVATGLALHAFLHRTPDYAGIALEGHRQRMLLEEEDGVERQGEADTPAARLAKLRAGHGKASGVQTVHVATPHMPRAQHSRGSAAGMGATGEQTKTTIDENIPRCSAEEPGANGQQAASVYASAHDEPEAHRQPLSLRTERLTQEQHWDTLARWMVRQVPHSGAILSRAGVRPDEL